LRCFFYRRYAGAAENNRTRVEFIDQPFAIAENFCQVRRRFVVFKYWLAKKLAELT
jgi:hypothetical protein